LPPYYAALLFSIALCFLFPAVRNNIVQLTSAQNDVWPPKNLFWQAVFSHIFLVHNWFNSLHFRFNGPLWSVATEWQIYFLFPLVLLPVRKQFGIIAAVIIGFAFAIAAVDQQLFAACPWFVGSFALGVLASDVSAKNSRVAGYSPAAAGGAIALIVLIHFTHRFGWTARYLATDFALSLLCASVLVYLRGAPKSLLARIFQIKPLTFLGEFSYSLYLIHKPLLVLFVSQCAQQKSATLHVILLTLIIPGVVFEVMSIPV
jgi:peptidoglycan/LPS O-acetylase OafA/YrhL